MSSFALWVGLGATLGLWRVAQSVPQRQANYWTDTGLAVLAAALIGSRAFYVGINWGYFSKHWTEAFQIWLGGLSWPGAVAGAGLALLLIAANYTTMPNSPLRLAQFSIGVLGDRLYPLLPPLVISTWIGCWQIGAVYGAALPANAWWGLPGLGENGLPILRFPLQSLAALTLLLFFWFLETRIRQFHTPGILSALALTGFFVHLLTVSLLRADPAPIWHGLRVDTWAAILFLVFFGSFLTFNNLVIPVWKKQTFSILSRSRS